MKFYFLIFICLILNLQGCKIKQYEFKGIFNENNDTSDTSEKITYHKHDFDHNKLIIKKIITDIKKYEPYVKIVAWCTTINNLMKWKKFFETRQL